MEIRFVSSLTPEDENRFAGAFAKAIGSLLDLLPITYSLRIETSSGKTFERTHSPFEPVLQAASASLPPRSAEAADGGSIA
jgi:hypothetical protein